MPTQHDPIGPDQSKDTWEFRGFASPTTTPVPDEFFDILAPRLSEAELRVLLYIIRRTFGFKKQTDAISLTQMVNGIQTKDGRILDYGTGMSRRGVMKGCAGLVEKGVIQVERSQTEKGDSEINIYSLRFRDEGGVGNDVPYGRERRAPRVGNDVPPQQTVEQETVKQETDQDLSKFRKADTPEKKDEVSSSDNPVASYHPRRGNDEDSRIRQVNMEDRNDEDQNRGMTTANAHNQTNASTIRGILNGDKQEHPSSEYLDPAPSLSNGFEHVGATLDRTSSVPESSAAEDRQVIEHYIRDFARELHDAAPIKSSVTRAFRLYQQSGWTLDGFISVLYEARSVTKERSASIHATDNAKTLPAKRKMAYFFACLEDKLGLREQQPQ